MKTQNAILVATIFFSTLVLCLILPNPTMACSPSPLNISEYIENSKAVVYGEVISVNENGRRPQVKVISFASPEKLSIILNMPSTQSSKKDYVICPDFSTKFVEGNKYFFFLSEVTPHIKYLSPQSVTTLLVDSQGSIIFNDSIKETVIKVLDQFQKKHGYIIQHFKDSEQDQSLQHQNPFPDTLGHWANDDILWGWQYGIVEGYEDGTFRPDQSITQHHFLTILIRAFNPSAIENQVVFNRKYIYGYASTMNWDVIDEGDKPLNRGKAAQILTGALGLNLNIYHSIQYLLDENYATGKVEKTKSGFLPEEQLTRSEATRLIYMFFSENSSLKKRSLEPTIIYND